MSVFSDIKKAFKRIGQLDDKIGKLGNDLGKHWHRMDRIDWFIRKELDDVRANMGKVAGRAEDQLEKTVTEKVPELVQEYLAELERAVAREGLRQIRDAVEAVDREIEAVRQSRADLADALDLPGGAIKLGPMTLKYSGFFTRTEKLADSLDHYVNDPPRFRRKPLLQLVEALGPDSVDLGIDIGAALLVVKSETLSVGFSVDELPMEVFTEVADAIMEACGVPE